MMPTPEEREAFKERMREMASISCGVGEGWWEPIEHGVYLLDKVYPGWTLSQIKEKFGGLRFYAEAPAFRDQKPGDKQDEIWYDQWRDRYYANFQAICDAIEGACHDLCEVCGDPGELVGDGFVHTLCEEHGRRYLEQKTMRGLAEPEVLTNA